MTKPFRTASETAPATTLLRERLRDADPAAGTTAYSTERQATVLARILARPDDLPADVREPATAGPQADQGVHDLRTRSRRRRFRVALAGTLTALVAGGTAVVLLPTDAVAAEMDRLASTVRPTLPSADRYLYTRTSHRLLEGDTTPGRSWRRWTEDTVQSWQGDTCNDRTDEHYLPVGYLHPGDEARFRASLDTNPSLPAWYREQSLHGWSVSQRGADLWATDHVPCDRTGDFFHPNPRYAATLPTDPDAFLAKVTRESAVPGGGWPGSPADAVLSLLALPYLTPAQRAVALKAFGKAAGQWQVTGHTTIAGVPGVVVRRDLGPVDEEQVIAAAAPGVLRRRVIVTDPTRVAGYDRRFVGLPAGTVVEENLLLAVAVVPDLNTVP